MLKENIVIISIFYVIVTVFFLILLIKEKKISEKMKVRREKYVNNLIKRLNWNSNSIKVKVLSKLCYWIESIGSAIILVLIIQKIYLGNFLVPTGSMIPTIQLRNRLFGNMVVYKFRTPKREEIIVFREPIQDKVYYTKRVMGLPGEKVEIKNNYLYVNNNKIDTREYSNLGRITKNKVWQIPKKGDILEIVPGKKYNDYIWKVQDKIIDVDEVQKRIKENGEALESFIPDVKFVVNGQETGPIMDFIRDKGILNELFQGKSVKIELKDNYYLALGDNTNESYDSRFWGFVKENRIKGKIFFRFWPISEMGFVK